MVRRKMEELRKLEEVQRVMALMHSNGLFISSSSSVNGDSHRFLANFVLLLVQPCGDLNMDAKLSLISEYIPKISASFLEEASLSLSNEGYQPKFFESTLPLNCKDKTYYDAPQTNVENMAMVGLDAMKQANSTLEDFCRSYYMFHGMDANKPQSIFKYLPTLSFTESYIYQLDRLNEKIVCMSMGGVTVSESRPEEANQSYFTKFMDAFKSNPFRPLEGLLECNGLLTERIREEFRCGQEYWALERKLCSSLTRKQEISIEDAMRAIHLKSFDYRVLNLLLYQLRGVKVIDLHMEFLSISEFLVEVSDDLFDYEDDVLENNFNILRMFVHIYGASIAPTMLAKYIAEAETKYDSLLKRLEPQLSSNYQRRCEEATREGGKTDGFSFGTWSLPPLIVDEELYRSNFINST